MLKPQVVIGTVSVRNVHGYAGPACGCCCASGCAILVAKKGEKTSWHFAHYGVEIDESYAESAMRAAAKQVLLDHNWLHLPSAHVVVSGQTT
jgi:competence CoiA-like predicted nuclease